MSKAVTNEEVEDVLSSIRRLVSEDKRPLAGLRSAPVAAAAPEFVAPDELVSEDLEVAEPKPTEALDRFVLTPALRVTDIPSEATNQPEDTSPLDLGAVARQTWVEDDSDMEEAVAEIDDAPLMLFPQDTAQNEARVEGDDPAMDAVDALVHDTLESEADDEVDGDYSDESYWDDEPAAESPADFDIEAHERRRAEEEAAFSVNGVADEVSADEPSVDEPRVDDAPVVGVVADVADRSEDPIFTSETELYGETDNISILPLTAKIAALEAAVGGIQQEWEPDGNEEEDLVPADATAMAWEDDIDLDAHGAPVFEGAQTPEQTLDTAEPETAEEDAPLGGALGGDDQLLDEEALRELVSEIVRAELQGALGERITRNVRKLVRREIHRALTAQELE